MATTVARETVALRASKWGAIKISKIKRKLTALVTDHSRPWPHIINSTTGYNLIQCTGYYYQIHRQSSLMLYSLYPLFDYFLSTRIFWKYDTKLKFSRFTFTSVRSSSFDIKSLLTSYSRVPVKAGARIIRAINPLFKLIKNSYTFLVPIPSASTCPYSLLFGSWYYCAATIYKLFTILLDIVLHNESPRRPSYYFKLARVVTLCNGSQGGDTQTRMDKIPASVTVLIISQPSRLQCDIIFCVLDCHRK